LKSPFSVILLRYNEPPSDCPDCSGGDRVVKDVGFEVGMNCEGKNSLTIGPGVKTKKVAKVRFKTPKVTIKNGVNADEDEGSYVSIQQQ